MCNNALCCCELAITGFSSAVLANTSGRYCMLCMCIPSNVMCIQGCDVRTIKHNTDAEHVCGEGVQLLSPAVPYLAGQLSVEAGTMLPLVARHNTVCMLFCAQDQCMQRCNVQSACSRVDTAQLPTTCAKQACSHWVQQCNSRQETVSRSRSCAALSDHPQYRGFALLCRFRRQVHTSVQLLAYKQIQHDLCKAGMQSLCPAVQYLAGNRQRKQEVCYPSLLAQHSAHALDQCMQVLSCGCLRTSIQNTVADDLCKAGMQSLGPAVQYLAGELSVEAGTVLPLEASHNTVRMLFHVEEGDYLHLAKPDASFPPQHFSMLADTRRNKVQARLPQI